MPWDCCWSAVLTWRPRPTCGALFCLGSECLLCPSQRLGDPGPDAHRAAALHGFALASSQAGESAQDLAREAGHPGLFQLALQRQFSRVRAFERARGEEALAAKREEMEAALAAAQSRHESAAREAARKLQMLTERIEKLEAVATAL